MKKKSLLLIVLSLLLCGTSFGDLRRARSDAAARGMAVNLPLVGRLTGAGNTLYRTSVDVSNNTGGAAQVDYYFDGRDSAGALVTATGSITNNGLAPLGADRLRGMTNVHFDDFIDSLVQAGVISAGTRDRGVSGSLMLIFENFSGAGQGAAIARFWNDYGGGTVGVSISGREITSQEPTTIVGVVQDTRGGSGSQLYTNMFINNTGLTRDGLPAGFVVVELRAVSATTGQDLGGRTSFQIQSGQTHTVSDVTTQLQIPQGQQALVLARVTQGDATIHGIISTIDSNTRDGSVVYMSKAD